jgi:hypothetical protein
VPNESVAIMATSSFAKGFSFITKWLMATVRVSAKTKLADAVIKQKINNNFFMVG